MGTNGHDVVKHTVPSQHDPIKALATQSGRTTIPTPRQGLFHGRRGVHMEVVFRPKG